MVRLACWLAFFCLLGWDLPDLASAQTERVVLRATNPRGVPIHPGEGSRQMSGRLPDGSEVSVVRWGEGRRWLEVRADDGTRGWIVRRYLRREDAPASRDVAPDVFRSLGECETVLASRSRAAPGGPRIASWNVRWFPDGSSRGPGDHATDVPHLACVIASLDVDAIALQEIMLHERGVRAIERLVSALDQRTGGRWRARFDGCPRDGRLHVGWLVNEARVRVEGVTQLDALNPVGGCRHRLRPGLAMYLRFANGPDLHAIVLHLDSGVEDRDYRNRGQSLVALEGAIAMLRPRDDDVLVIGDLNTMGRRAPAVSAQDELAVRDATLAGLTPALRRVESDVPCTAYYRRRGSLLDHALVSVAMVELPRSRVVEVTGACERYRCRLPRGAHPPSLERLSDHCPIVLQLDAADRD